MNLKEYKKIVDKYSKKENKFINILVSFITGGLIGLFGQVFVEYLMYKFYLPVSEAYMYLMITLVIIGSILTGTGYFDKIVSFESSFDQFLKQFPYLPKPKHFHHWHKIQLHHFDPA